MRCISLQRRSGVTVQCVLCNSISQKCRWQILQAKWLQLSVSSEFCWSFLFVSNVRLCFAVKMQSLLTKPGLATKCQIGLIGAGKMAQALSAAFMNAGRYGRFAWETVVCLSIQDAAIVMCSEQHAVGNTGDRYFNLSGATSKSICSFDTFDVKHFWDCIFVTYGAI